MFKQTATALAAFFISCALAQTSPYAGQQDREVKALSGQEIADLLSGQGMGLAKAAELNGYPGPAHILEHADALGLSVHQRHATQQLMDAHKKRARILGQELVDAESRLDHAFRARSVDGEQLSRLTAEIGNKQAHLREEHLRTHLAQTALLEPSQVERYAVLRGYAPAEGRTHAPAQRHRQH
jgi:hypothetical protein